MIDQFDQFVLIQKRRNIEQYALRFPDDGIALAFLICDVHINRNIALLHITKLA